MIKPTVGRVVWYYPRGQVQAAAGYQPNAAIVVQVEHDRKVNLTWFNESGVAESAICVRLLQDDDVPLGAEAYAVWMPYQLGQAARTEAAEKR